jgi:hypothetical protein
MDIFATVAGKRSRGIATALFSCDLPDIPAGESWEGPFEPLLETVSNG